MNATRAGCPPQLHGASVALGFIILGLVVAVLGLAYSYPRNPRRLFANIGRVLAAISVLVFGVGVVIGWTGHRDGCGQLSSVASTWTTALVLAGIALMVIGLAVVTATEWAPMLLVAVVDAGMVGYACLGDFGRQDRAIGVLFGTHGICVAVASWWSWRARGRDAAARAKASEAGRLLVGGLAAVALLDAASSSQPATNPVLTNSSLGAALIATALAVALGTGYTKYVEAMASDPDPDRPLPRSSIPPGLRSRGVAIAKAYRAGLSWATKPRPRRPRAAAIRTESPQPPENS